MKFKGKYITMEYLAEMLSQSNRMTREAALREAMEIATGDGEYHGKEVNNIRSDIKYLINQGKSK
jgi:tellurite resistance protein